MSITAQNLSYVFPNGLVGIHPTSFDLPPGSRTLLIGANGAGKSTLLRILAGKTLAKADSLVVQGFDPFRDCSPPGIRYLGTEWAGNPIVRHDIEVTQLLKYSGGDAYPDRRDHLVQLLDVDPTWHMHEVSDGERRRVQLVMGLLVPWETLLLDEVTVDLDVLARTNLLNFLKEETETRQATIVYATHIFDGLNQWPTHVAHMSQSTMLSCDTYDVVQKQFPDKSILEIALGWITGDMERRGPRLPRAKRQRVN
ncbi:putative ABC transporter ATP-binding protein [Yarrowia sp. C11]|nr:putative ABC transporter ATP-binding protein [Yarrowia sp. E02]KAG5367527.1 putative ABC transporter ATP-binding protein [Yarrowia sp. C11]